MQTATLYIRVSTDEQAVKGYSSINQEERLRRFCMSSGIKILQTVFEDYTAKTFKRPAWSDLMTGWKHNKGTRPDLLLFTRWDRFSRITADAYDMIGQLQRLGITPQAIDQLLDLSIPENKVLLAMYIVMAEVENERRSLNVSLGLHKAKMEGRWIGKAPYGYVSKLSDSGKSVIVPQEPEALLVRKIFEGVIEQNVSIRELYRQSVHVGLNCSLNTLWNILYSPVYCGKVRVPPFEGHKAYFVPGIHQAIISEALYDKVQRALKSRSRTIIKRDTLIELLPLKGFLHCPNCHKKLTGSGSTGRSKRYYYYHCFSGCNFRVRADLVNSVFEQGISNLHADDAYINLYREILSYKRSEFAKERLDDGLYLRQNIRRLIERCTNSKALLIKGTIDQEDYLSIKSDCDQRIDLLGKELYESYTLAQKEKKKLEQFVTRFVQPGLFYKRAGIIVKQRLQGLLLNNDLIFDLDNFSSNLRPCIWNIYNIAFPGLQNDPHMPLPSRDQFDARSAKWLDKLIHMEQKRNTNISTERCKQMLTFLIEFTRL